MSTVQLHQVIAKLETYFPPETAAEWDSVGLVVGDSHAAISKILLTVDVTQEVVDQAIEEQVDLIVAHHPLLLRGVHTVAESTSKGRIVTQLVRKNIALYTAHTNADSAWPGVSDALAEVIGAKVRDGVALDVVSKIGRIADFPEPLTVTELAQLLDQKLSQSASPIQVAGNLDKHIRSIAVCGGAGDSLLGEVALANVDAYLTADLRHHVASEFVATNDCVLINIAHWVSEWPWLNSVSALLEKEFEGSINTVVSLIPTDPWTLSVAR